MDINTSNDNSMIERDIYLYDRAVEWCLCVWCMWFIWTISVLMRCDLLENNTEEVNGSGIISLGGIADGGLRYPYEFEDHFSQRSRADASIEGDFVFARVEVDVEEEDCSIDVNLEALEAAEDDE